MNNLAKIIVGLCYFLGVLVMEMGLLAVIVWIPGKILNWIVAVMVGLVFVVIAFIFYDNYIVDRW